MVPPPASARTDRSGTDTSETRILRSALRVFSTYGYRKASMSSIARGADLSRTALYRHHASKEEVFRALVVDLHERMLEGARRAAAAEADVAGRLLGMLEAKHLFFFELLHGSPHGDELIGEHERLSAASVSAYRGRYLRLVADVLAGAEAEGAIRLRPTYASAAVAAEALYLAAVGMEGEADWRPDTATYRARLHHLVELTVRALSSAPPGHRGSGRRRHRTEPSRESSP